jgi:glucan biosynthesis protein
MNQIQIEGKTLRMQLTADLAKHSQEIAEQRYAGVASTLSSTSSAFKKAAYQSPQFKAKYPEVYAQIMANQIKADLHIDKIKREPQE